MNELQVGILVSVAGLFGTALGYFAKRFIEGTSVAEKLTRMNIALEIKRKMIEGNFTTEDVEQMVKELLPKWPWARQQPNVAEQGEEGFESALLRARSTALAELSAGDPPNFGDGPQQVINRQQAERLERANAIMARTVAELRALIEEDAGHIANLAVAQTAWERYRDAQAQFASLIFEGGTMQPLIRDGAATALTIERIVELRVNISERRRLQCLA